MEDSKTKGSQQCFRRSTQQQEHEPDVDVSREKPWRDCYKVGDARIFPEQNCVMQPDNTYKHIRPKSFLVLVYLCENSGRLILKDHLISAAWGKVCVTDDSLVQCIVDIRRCLGPENSKNLRTVNRLGYTLHAEKLVNKPTGNNTITLLIGPFSSTTKDPGEYFAKGLCDSVTMRLIQKQGNTLHLARNKDHQHVNYHLLGSLQINKEQIRVLLLLLDVSLSEYTWAKSYQHSSTDTFALQDALGETIANDLISKLLSTHSYCVGKVIDIAATN